VSSLGHTRRGWLAAAVGLPRHWAVLLLLLAASAGSGCDGSDQPPPPQGRSDKVAATGKPTAQPSATSTQSPAPRRPAKRKLCPSREELPAPEEISEARSIAGAPQLPALRYGKGRWQWVNLWAAWCKPCKEEMPRLIEWRDQLRAKGVAIDLSFVSIDDDEREMTRFMSSQPKTGVRASYWLETEKTRETWFESVGFDDTPELPIHVLVTPAGKLTCVIKGALEPTDYPQLEALFLGKKGP